MSIVYKEIGDQDQFIFKFETGKDCCQVPRNSDEIRSWIALGNEIVKMFDSPRDPLPEEEDTAPISQGLYPIQYNADGSYVPESI